MDNSELSRHDSKASKASSKLSHTAISIEDEDDDEDAVFHPRSEAVALIPVTVLEGRT